MDNSVGEGDRLDKLPADPLAKPSSEDLAMFQALFRWDNPPPSLVSSEQCGSPRQVSAQGLFSLGLVAIVCFFAMDQAIVRVSQSRSMNFALELVCFVGFVWIFSQWCMQ